MRGIACVLILGLVALCGIWAQSDEKTDCSKMKFETLPKDCCAKPFGLVFVAEKLPGNIKECKGKLDWLNSYKINTIQNKDLKNFINEKDPKIVKSICEQAAFANCVFTKNDFMNDTGIIDVDTLKKYIQGVAPSDAWKNIIAKMMDPMNPLFTGSYTFTDIVEDRFEKANCSGSATNMLPLIMAQMIQSELIWMCPQQNTTNSKCPETMKNYQFCDGKIYSPLAKGVFYFPSV